MTAGKRAARSWMNCMDGWPGRGLEPIARDKRLEAAETSVPRASLILRRCGAELWMGGTQSGTGEPLNPANVAGALVVDCAGDAPAWLRGAATAWIPRVFADLESPPDRLDALLHLADELAARLHEIDPSGESPQRLYVLCQQGMNRSALLTGLILRACGLDGQETVQLLRRLRPGCLTNLTFMALLLAEPASLLSDG